MSISSRLKQYMDGQGVHYETVPHPWSVAPIQAAHRAHVSDEQTAKSVVIHHEMGYVLAVVPSTYRVELGQVQAAIGKRLGLASESEVGSVFGDCDRGAVPPVGIVWGVDTIVDESLLGMPEVYFEGGDHRTLVHVSGDVFGRLMKDARRARIGHHA